VVAEKKLAAAERRRNNSRKSGVPFAFRKSSVASLRIPPRVQLGEHENRGVKVPEE
jgi:hypothetical protein